MPVPNPAFLEPGEGISAILPQAETKLLFFTVVFLGFLRSGYRGMRKANGIMSKVSNAKRLISESMHIRVVAYNLIIMLFFGGYLLAFILSRLRLCKTLDEETGSLKRTECVDLTARFLPRNVAIHRASAETYVIGLGLFWVMYKLCSGWSRLRMVMTFLGIIVVQLVESCSVIAHESPKKDIAILITRVCAIVNFVAAASLGSQKLLPWEKAFEKPVEVIKPEKHVWYPMDGVTFDEVKNQYYWGNTIILSHYAYHIYLFIGTFDFFEINLADPFALWHNFIFLLLCSILPLGYRKIYQAIADDKRRQDPNQPPQGRPPFFLRLHGDHIIAIKKEDMEEFMAGGSSQEPQGAQEAQKPQDLLTDSAEKEETLVEVDDVV